MSFPIRICVICHQEFELRPDKPGFANRCPECSAAEETSQGNKPGAQRSMDADERKAESEANEARRLAIRNLLYRGDS